MEKYEFALLTSVTKKIRRVFTFPKERFYHNLNLTGFHYGNVLLSLNFVNFIDKDVYGVTSAMKKPKMTPVYGCKVEQVKKKKEGKMIPLRLK